MRLGVLALVLAVFTSACSGIFKPEYEYEEELYLSLDGAAQVNVHASVASLVALHGADFDIDPRARIDRNKVRALFEGPGVQVSTPTFSRRDGRRFVHVRVDVEDIRRLSRIAPFSWSTYQLERRGETVDFRQRIGRPAARPAAAIDWTGNELVAFKMHLPSKIDWHNAPSREVQRGNILEWAQPLQARLAGEPLHLEVHLQGETILYTTLLLFGSTILAAAAAFALVIWWIVRRGGDPDVAESRS